ncbi:hypothetical protein FNH22_06265 [Fulvivirga sp. M361]|uniref:M56 family metallopeptidase n=1 Tax=Fulvivirga sp. M361 TaxID=2594266 RepID=UPI00117A5595|nr:M56 family metallopeptidase [Fulvivirga sp. M361]TRX60645.1 hypothetical protein FNH22_06265 [Fulvivirga sp. M361]
MMESYLLKSSIALIILYILYQWILKYGSNHQLNRFIGLSCLMFSAGFLFVPYDLFLPAVEYSTAIYTVVKNSADLQEGFTKVVSGEIFSIHLIIYFMGVGLFSVRSLVGLVTLVRLYIGAEKSFRWGFKVVKINRPIAPFTFFNRLFIGQHSFEDEDIKALIIHEQYHRDQYHSIDALITEVFSIIYWFNPAVWLFRRDIRAEHEYMADQQVLRKGYDQLNYQHLLFQAQTGVSLSLGNYLSNTTSLKKRFNMMNKRKFNTKRSYLHVAGFSLLMIALMALSAFSEQYIGQIPDRLPVYEEGENAMYDKLGKSMVYSASARLQKRSGLIYVSFKINENGEMEDIRAEQRGDNLLKEIVIVGYSKVESMAKPTSLNEDDKKEVIRAVKTPGKFIPAEKEGKRVSCVLNLPIRFKLG